MLNKERAMRYLLSQEIHHISGGQIIHNIDALKRDIVRAKQEGCTLAKAELSHIKTDNPLIQFGSSFYAIEEISNMCSKDFSKCQVKYIFTCTTDKEAVKNLYHQFLK
jgi:hypothetical protein